MHSPPPATPHRSPWQPVRILRSGWTQTGTAVLIGLELENPNDDLAFSDIVVEAASHGQDGGVISTTTAALRWLPPRARALLAAEDYLGAEIPVAALTLSVRDATSCPMRPLQVSDVSHGQDGPYSAFARGTVHNPWPVAVENVAIAAVLFNRDGAIIGGARIRLEQIDAGGSANVRVGLPPELDPARVELSAVLDPGSRFV